MNLICCTADYFNNVIEVDISRVDDVERDPALAAQLLKSYARNISTLATKASIRKDVFSVREVSMPTVDSYLSALRKLFVINDVGAWCPAVSASNARFTNGDYRGRVCLHTGGWCRHLSHIRIEAMITRPTCFAGFEPENWRNDDLFLAE